MKFLNILTLAISIFASGAISAAEEEPKEKSLFPPLGDPRIPIYRTFSKGEKAPLVFSECFVVIAWDKSISKRPGYQIWGDDRILSKEQLESSLVHLYGRTTDWPERPHLIVAGNQWGAGRELDPILKKLSKEFSIDTFFHGGTHRFLEVDFAPEERQEKIRDSVTSGIKEVKKDGAAEPPSTP